MKKLLLSLLFFTSSVFASQCPSLYPESKPIVVPNTVELCNTFFVSVYDKVNQKVIVVSEHLKKGSVGSVERDNQFHSDSRIGSHPSPSQYVGTGLDKGHMAPAGDSSNTQEMFETFLMTNMTPQKPTLNRIAWRMLEEHTRQLLDKSKSDMYVVNIAVYGNNNLMNGIPIPTGYWKIVSVDGATHYFYADNVDHAPVVEKQPVPIESLVPH
jgi:endonuclease G